MNLRLPTFFAVLSLVAASFAASPPPPPGSPIVPASALETISTDQARLELARVLYYAKNYDEALVEYRLVIAARPTDNALRAEFGQVLGWAGRSAEAVVALTSVPVTDLSPAAAVLLADLVLGEKDYPKAAALYRQALAVAPADFVTRFKLARVLSWEKRYDEALAEYRTLLAANSDDVQVRRHYAQTLGWAGRQEEAVGEWRRTLPATNS